MRVWLTIVGFSLACVAACSSGPPLGPGLALLSASSGATVAARVERLDGGEVSRRRVELAVGEHEVTIQLHQRTLEGFWVIDDEGRCRVEFDAVEGARYSVSGELAPSCRASVVSQVDGAALGECECQTQRKRHRRRKGETDQDFRQPEAAYWPPLAM